MSTIVLLCIIFGPAVVFTILRVNAVFVYLGLCLGAVASEYVATSSTIVSFVSDSHFTQQLSNNSNLRITLILLPPILITLFMIRSSKERKLLSLNLLPSVAVGLLAAYLIVPLLSFSTAQSILTNSLWMRLRSDQSILVGISSLAVLVLFIMHQSKAKLASSHGDKHKK